MSQASQTHPPALMSPDERDMIAGLLGEALPATTGLLVSFGEAIRDRREHEHPDREDWFCLNLAAYMGERMAPVLRRLLDAETELDRLRLQVAELEVNLAAKAQDAEAAVKGWGRARVRVAELEAAAPTTCRADIETALGTYPCKRTAGHEGDCDELTDQSSRDTALTVFRASHDSIVMGHYTTRDAAQAHCEAKVRQEEPAGSIRHLSWSADDIGDQAEYELHITPAETGGLIRGTGYVVTPLTVSSEYDAEADE